MACNYHTAKSTYKKESSCQYPKISNSFGGGREGTGVSKITGLFLHSLLKCEVITKETEAFASGIEELRWGLLWASKDELHMLLRK